MGLHRNPVGMQVRNVMTQNRSRAALVSLASMLVAASFVGCPLLKKKGADAGDESAEDAATVAAAGVGAKNEANVLRYARETALPNEPAVIGAEGAVARNFPGNGPEVATLPKGTAVAKIAQYFSTGTLVMFDDPSGDGSKLIGWVSPKAFDAAAPPPAKPVVVPPPVRITDAGAAPAAPKDAGAPVVVKDAGAPVVADAGKPATTVDAGGGGGASTQPSKSAVALPPDAKGKCLDGWAVSPDTMCRRKCAADAECPRGTKCLLKGSNKVCTSG